MCSHGRERTVEMPRWKTRTRSEMSALLARSSSWLAQKRRISSVSMYSQFTSTGLLNCAAAAAALEGRKRPQKGNKWGAHFGCARRLQGD